MNDTLNKIYELGECISKMRSLLAELGIASDMGIEVDKKSDGPVSEKRQPTVNRKKKVGKKWKVIGPRALTAVYGATTETDDSLSDKRSDCCGKQIVVVGGDEGTNHYECTSCGDACDVETDESRAAKVLDQAKKMECKACVTGRGRHKAYCPKANGKVVERETKAFVCDACQTRFEDYVDTDIKCPSCFGKDVWPDV